MKVIAHSLLALAAVTLIGACDSHPWSETQKLHEKFAEQGHGAEAGHAAPAEHGAAPAAHGGEAKAGH